MNRLSKTHDDLNSPHRPSQSIELLTFVFNEVIFGLDILKVKEIHSYKNLYSLVDMNNSIHSDISVRGNNVEIIDFGVKFGLFSKSNQWSKIIIILNYQDKQFGIFVDGVAEVISTDWSLLIMPDLSEDAFRWLNCASGLIKIDENFLVVLDVEKLITQHEISLEDVRHGE